MVEESSRSEATRSVFRVDLFEGKVALVTGGGEKDRYFLPRDEKVIES